MSVRPAIARLAAVRPAALLATGLLSAAACADRGVLSPEPATPSAGPSAALSAAGCRTGCPTVNNKGKLVFARNVVANQSGQLELFKSNPDGSELVRLTTTAEAESEPSWSPDFSRIVFVRKFAPGGPGDLFVMDADGTNVKRLTNTANVDESYPSWRPDGKGIVFASNHLASATYAGTWQLSIMDVNGNGSYTTFFPHLAGVGIEEKCVRDLPCTPHGNKAQSIAYPHMAPNNREVVYGVWNPIAGRPGLRVMDLYDQTKKRWIYGDTPLPADQYVYPQSAYPRFSPDGTRIGYLLDDAVVVADAATGSVLTSASTSRILISLSWSPDGTGLVTHSGFPNTLLRVSASNGSYSPLFNSAGAQAPSWSR
jgi:hypothetical protein